MGSDLSLADLQEILQRSREAAREAGKILMENYGKVQPQDVEEKSAFDFVTVVDRKAEAAILEILSRYFPAHSVHAEESGREDRSSEYQWLIDPLDGTKNYIHHFPVFSVSIGLKKGEEILAGLVYAPALGEWFTAMKGHGAFLNGEPIRVSPVSRLEHSMVATGFPHAAKQFLDVYIETFRKIFLRVSAVRRAGSAALDLAYTACGRFEGFWEFKLNPWDIGAGILLVQEAGGIITDPLGGDRFFQTGDIVAGNPAIQPQLLAMLKPICEGRLGW